MSMRVPSHVVGVKGDECQCGRRATIRHCISCGSVRVYARMNRAHLFHSGETRYVATEFRCQSCGYLFVEEEREFCEAPPVNAALAQQKIKALHDARQSGEYLRPLDAKIADSVEALLAPSQEDSKKAFDKLVFQLRIEYVDRKAAGEEMTQTMEQHVESRLKELKVTPPTSNEPPVIPNEVIAQPKDEADAQRDAIPVEERSIRLEWGRKKLAGRVVPDIEDYVRRRLAGELFE